MPCSPYVGRRQGQAGDDFAPAGTLARLANYRRARKYCRHLTTRVHQGRLRSKREAQKAWYCPGLTMTFLNGSTTLVLCTSEDHFYVKARRKGTNPELIGILHCSIQVRQIVLIILMRRYVTATERICRIRVKVATD